MGMGSWDYHDTGSMMSVGNSIGMSMGAIIHNNSHEGEKSNKYLIIKKLYQNNYLKRDFN
jgi:hypothetical protein